MKLNVRLIRESFESLRPQGDAMVGRFYSILFSRHPDIQRMFAKTDMEAQRKKFFDTLDEIIRHLEEPDKTLSDLLVLGNSHVDYGVKADQYPAVCDALVEAMKQSAGKTWTPELEGAWRDAYSTVADIMKKGAALRRPPK
ncbi:MAG TPA: globin domain-containing protein [Planctomycetota bacterium]|jgi:hemoglobin-like flavoprotein|nr:globin domain-containing protein [Planctomycetota bacterium]